MKYLLPVILTSLVAAQPVQAKASKEETVGLGSGAIIGAVAGGPVGFIVGAAIGAKLGDNYHKKNERIETLNAELDLSRNTIDDLELDLVALNRDIDSMAEELEHIQQASNPELTRLLEAGIAMDLLFHTDEFQLPEGTTERFRTLGQRLASMPSVHVQLDGFADQRGASEYNQALSQKRVEAIRDQLVEAGVAAERITAIAHGERPATSESPDSLALDRRVSMTLSLAGEASFAANPE